MSFELRSFNKLIRWDFTSSINDFASFLNTSGAIFGTFSQYSPINHKIEARAAGTVIKSINLAI